MTESDHILEAKPLCTLHGIVVHGKGQGRRHDMPTANIDAYSCGELPKLGVYASVITVAKKKYIGITNIGYRPTVDDEKTITVETHILDFDNNIYGEEILIDLYHYLRPTRQFDSLDQVKEQIDRDENQTRELMTKLGFEILKL